jgi:AcrR family transcriptional regulator
MNPMAVRSQEPSFDSSGRVNQKRRTRNAIVAAARAILDRGESPTVAQAAEEALVSRTTAYRYFPTQESLLLELSITVSLAEIDELLARPLDGSTPEDRLLELVDVFNRHVSANEVFHRTAQRLYMDTWLAAERAGEGHDYQLRQGRRRQWISAALAPLRDSIPTADFQRLEAALCLTTGGEAFTVLRDVCQLDPDQAVAVAHWAAKAILGAGIRAEPSRSRQPASARVAR